MLAAEKRYQVYDGYYSNEYTQKQYSDKKKAITLSNGDKAKILLMLLALGAICIVMIISSALTTQIKYNVNAIHKDINVLEGEIENLIVEIEKESKIVSIEQKALTELGMVYPSGEQIVFLENSIQRESDFAGILREEAFN